MLRLASGCLPLLLVALLATPCAQAQDAARETVIPQENVRFDYAQVLAVNPVFQIL